MARLWSGPAGHGRLLGRLLAAGWPEWIGTDGHTIGWVVRDRLFLQDPGSADCRMIELPDGVEDVRPAADGWVVALGQGFVVVDAARSEIVAAVLDDDSDPVGTRAGRHVGVLLEVPASRLLVLADGAEVPLPDGANRSRWVTPFASGVGAVWVDADVVYRLRGPSIAPVGRIRGVQEVVCGPDGALLVRGRAGTLVAAARGLGVDAPRVDAARIAPDGLHALAVDADGALRIDLTDGRVLQRWSGRFDPIGWLDGVPWVLDRALGAVRPLDGGAAPIVGFCGARPAWLAGVELAGPGGRRWSPDGGSLAEPPLLDGLVAVGPLAGGRGLVHADEDVRVYVDGAQVGSIAGADVDAIRVAGGLVWVETDGGVAAFKASGEPVDMPEPDEAFEPDDALSVSDAGEDSVVAHADGRAWPVPADAAAEVGTEVWAWSDDGALYALAGAG